MIPDNYPYNVGFEWDSGYRVRRIDEVLSGIRDSGKKITLSDMEKLQADVVSLPARQLLKLLREASPNPTSAAQMLLGWDAKLNRESGPAALYEVWLKDLREAISGKEGIEREHELSLPKLLGELSESSPQVFGPDAVAGRNQVLLQTLDSAWKKTEELLGRDSQNWSWARLHTIRFHHPLDRLPGAERLLDLGPLSRPGDGYTVNATSVGENFQQQAGASYREILDTADWDQSLAVNTPGQSGQSGSPHYSDLLPLWDQGQYFPLIYSRTKVEMDTQDRLVLSPQ
jgi:penicillin amidase